MADVRIGWHPAENPVHRLVDLLDVLAIGLNRFMDASFGLPHRTSPGYTPTARHERLTQLRGDYRALCNLIFLRVDIGPGVTAEWLAGEALAYFARNDCDEGKVVSRRAATVLIYFASLYAPTPDPSHSLPRPPDQFDETVRGDERWECRQAEKEFHDTETANFERQYQLLQEYQAVRKGLIDSLRECGWSIPPDVHRRSNAAAVPADNLHVRDITPDTLPRLIEQAGWPPAGSAVPPAEGGEPAEADPHVPLIVDPTGGAIWPKVAEWLKELRASGAEWTSYADMGTRYGCSRATVYRAVEETPELLPWTKPQPVLGARGLNDVVTDNTAQNREPDPAGDAADIELRKLLGDDSPATRGWFAGLPRNQQLDVLRDPDKYTRIRGRRA